jgi:hypothetical protein
MSLSALCFQAKCRASCCDRNQVSRVQIQKYRRFTMEKARQLQCKALRGREKSRRPQEQWVSMKEQCEEQWETMKNTMG